MNVNRFNPFAEVTALRDQVSVPVQPEGVSASYKNGVLTVVLPKQEAAKPRKVTIAINRDEK